MFYRGSECRGKDQIATRRLVPPEIVIDRYVDYLGRAAVEDGQGLGADLVIEEEEGGYYWLGEEDMGLQLPWVRASNVAWSWE